MIRKIISLGIFNLIMMVVFVAGMLTSLSWYSNQQLKRSQEMTGYQVLNALNAYRESLGLPDFILYEPLCNNIASRLQHYRDFNNHDGLTEFHNKYMPDIKVLSEILAPGNTPEETVRNWRNSPSHDMFIKSNSKICVYSSRGLSVALLSN